MSALDTQVGGNHYKDGGSIQPVQYIEANGLKFLEGSVVKRMTRHDRPTGKGRQDVEKAIHELQLLLELRYPVLQCTPSPLPAATIDWPDGMNWMATDAYGATWFYENQPTQGPTTAWEDHPPGATALASVGPTCPHWRATLVARTS